MNIIRRYEELLATATESSALGLHDRARELHAEAKALEPEVAAARSKLRAAAGGPLAALAEQARAAQSQPQTSAWVGHETREQQLSKASRALSSVRMTEAQLRRHAEAAERENERLRRGGQ